MHNQLKLHLKFLRQLKRDLKRDKGIGIRRNRKRYKKKDVAK